MTEQQKAKLEADMDALMILAIRAGYKSDMPFGGDDTATPETRMNFMRYSLAIQNELNHTSVENILLSRFVELAVRFAGHKEISNFEDMHAMLRCSAMEIFYTRFAYQIAKAVNQQG